MAYITPTEVAGESLLALENNLVLANMVNRRFDPEFRKKGDTINIRNLSTYTAQEFSTTTSAQASSETAISLKLDHHLDTTVEVTSKELSLNVVDFRLQVLEPLLRAHAQKIDELIAGLYIDIPYRSGSAGVTPATKATITNARKVLNVNKCPVSDRWLVIDPEADDKLLQLDGFTEADKVGDAGSALREGSLGRKLGFNIEMDQNIAYHTAGVPGGSPVAAATAGATAVAITAGGASGTYAKGDLISIASDTAQYVVTEALTLDGAGAGSLKIYPALKVTCSAKAVTLVASHRANLAFQRNAFCLASATLEPPLGGAQSAVMNYKGLALRVVMGYGMSDKKNVISIDGLFGVKTLQPELAEIMLG